MRLYRKNNNSHFYTTSVREATNIVSNLGYKTEGVKLGLCSIGPTDIYRLFNKKNNSHFYTTSNSERESLISKGFRYEGVGFKSE